MPNNNNGTNQHTNRVEKPKRENRNGVQIIPPPVSMKPCYLKTPIPPRNCTVCGLVFSPYRSHQKRCSLECTKVEGAKGIVKSWGISCGSLGALAELLASVDLMKRGYEVFRALSPACSCDLIAMKAGVILRVEVRSARRKIDGAVRYPTKNIKGDQIAAVTHDDGAIHYVPELK
jgi:hypothetical protein